MYKHSSKSPFIFLTDDSGNKIMPIPVDQFDAADFNKAENGFPRGLMSQIIHAENEDIQRELMKRLVDMPKSETAGMTDRQIIDSIVPRYAATSASMADFVSRLEDTGISRSVKEFVESQTSKAGPSVEQPVPSVNDKIIESV